MSRWTDFVKQFAKKNGLSYGCAITKPECKLEYHTKYGNRKRLPQKTEKQLMGMEDINVNAIPKKIKKPKKKIELEIIEEPKQQTPIPHQFVKPVETKFEVMQPQRLIDTVKPKKQPVELVEVPAEEETFEIQPKVKKVKKVKKAVELVEEPVEEKVANEEKQMNKLIKKARTETLNNDELTLLKQLLINEMGPKYGVTAFDGVVAKMPKPIIEGKKTRKSKKIMTEEETEAEVLASFEKQKAEFEKRKSLGLVKESSENIDEVKPYVADKTKYKIEPKKEKKEKVGYRQYSTLTNVLPININDKNINLLKKTYYDLMNKVNITETQLNDFIEEHNIAYAKRAMKSINKNNDKIKDKDISDIVAILRLIVKIQYDKLQNSEEENKIWFNKYYKYYEDMEKLFSEKPKEISTVDEKTFRTLSLDQRKWIPSKHDVYGINYKNNENINILKKTFNDIMKKNNITEIEINQNPFTKKTFKYLQKNNDEITNDNIQDVLRVIRFILHIAYTRTPDASWQTFEKMNSDLQKLSYLFQYNDMNKKF